MTDGVDNGISGGNDREDRIGKFLREAPPKAHTLILATDPGEQVLSTWVREEWTELLPGVIDAEMQSQHEQADVSDTYYWLIFMGEPGDVRATRRRRFNVRTRKALVAGDGAPPLSTQLDGTGPASSALMQNTLFRMVQLYSTNMQSLLNTQERVISSLGTLVVGAQEREAAARQDLHELKELIVELRAAEADNTNGEMTDAQKAWFELAQKATQSPELQRLVDGVSRFLLAKFAG